MGWLSKEQEAALETVAKAFGWDKMPIEQLKLVMWCAVHYYVRRLR